MAKLVASYQVSAFITPVNATTIDADPVRGNDNTLRAALNNHDSDAGIHFQSSTMAERPVAGTADRKWITTDDRRVWIDDGSSWQEVAYISTGSTLFALAASPTITGTIIYSGSLLSLTGSAPSISHTGTGNLTISSVNAVTLSSGGNLTITAPASMFISTSGASPISLTSASSNVLISAGQTGGAGSVSITGVGVFLSATGAGVIGFSTNGAQRWIITATGKLTTGAGVQILDNARKTGWTTDPTGTLTRTTFVSDSVTLVELAKRVAGLIVDLRDHGLIGA